MNNNNGIRILYNIIKKNYRIQYYLYQNFSLISMCQIEL